MTSQRHHKLRTLKSGLVIPPSKPACFHILFSSWNDNTILPALWARHFHHPSLVYLFHLLYPIICKVLPTDLSLQYHSVHSSLHLWSYYSSLCHYYLITIPASEILLLPFLLLPVYSLHCNQDELFVIQIWLLASLPKIFFLVSHGLQR